MSDRKKALYNKIGKKVLIGTTETAPNKKIIQIRGKRKLNLDDSEDLGGGVDQLQNQPPSLDLQTAIQTGNKELVKLLILRGADPNQTDANGMTVLHYAMQIQDLGLVKLLIKNGANVNAQDTYGRSPLHLAIETGNKEVIKILLDSGANVNIRDNYGRTPIHYAINAEKEEIAKLLVKNAPNLKQKDEFGLTPLDYAFRKANSKIIEILKTRDELNSSLKNQEQERKVESAPPRYDYSAKKDNSKIVESSKEFETPPKTQEPERKVESEAPQPDYNVKKDNSKIVESLKESENPPKTHEPENKVESVSPQRDYNVKKDNSKIVESLKESENPPKTHEPEKKVELAQPQRDYNVKKDNSKIVQSSKELNTPPNKTVQPLENPQNNLSKNRDLLKHMGAIKYTIPAATQKENSLAQDYIMIEKAPDISINRHQKHEQTRGNIDTRKPTEATKNIPMSKKELETNSQEKIASPKPRTNPLERFIKESTQEIQTTRNISPPKSPKIETSAKTAKQPEQGKAESQWIRSR